MDSAGTLMEGDGRIDKYRGWAKLGVDEMLRRGRDCRFGSAWWWWRRRDGDGMG